MAKCKYRTLAAQIKDILKDIDAFVERGKEALQNVQGDFLTAKFYFYEKILPIGEEPVTKAYFVQQLKAHVMGMGILSPLQELRMACSSYRYSGKYHPPSACLRTQSLGTWWGVKTILPQDMTLIMEKGYWEALLYCPESQEISNEIDWFEKENYTNSLSFHFQLAIKISGIENDKKAVTCNNLNQKALTYFEPIVKQWKNDDGGNDTIPKDVGVIFTQPFAPTEDDYIANAYEKVLRTLKMGNLRNYEHLMILWRDCLEGLMFTNVKWADSEKMAFIKEWKRNIFGCEVKGQVNPDGRWKQTMAIDQVTAGKMIKYFIDRFLEDPSKKKRYGEIACLLWLLVWLTQDSDAGKISLTRILALDTENVSEERQEVVFDDKAIEVSLGLYRLLKILKGKGQGLRVHRLFTHISEDYIQDALKVASVVLFGAAATPVLPGAFLSFPHCLEGMRISKNQRVRMSMIDPGSEACYTRRQISKVLRES